MVKDRERGMKKREGKKEKQRKEIEKDKRRNGEKCKC
jgi:hypothetical protein